MTEREQRNEDLPWGSLSSWATLANVLHPPPDTSSQTKAARLLRIIGGLFAAAYLYHFDRFVPDGIGLRGGSVLAALALITFGPEIVAQRFLPDRKWRAADRLFDVIPWLFVAVSAVQVSTSIIAMWFGPTQANTVPFLATMYLCLCPGEFSRLRTITCLLASALCLGLLCLGDPRGIDASYIAFATAAAPPLIRGRQQHA